MKTQITVHLDQGEVKALDAYRRKGERRATALLRMLYSYDGQMDGHLHRRRWPQRGR